VLGFAEAGGHVALPGLGDVAHAQRGLLGGGCLVAAVAVVEAVVGAPGVGALQKKRVLVEVIGGAHRVAIGRAHLRPVLDAVAQAHGPALVLGAHGKAVALQLGAGQVHKYRRRGVELVGGPGGQHLLEQRRVLRLTGARAGIEGAVILHLIAAVGGQRVAPAPRLQAPVEVHPLGAGQHDDVLLAIGAAEAVRPLHVFDGREAGIGGRLQRLVRRHHGTGRGQRLGGVTSGRGAVVRDAVGVGGERRGRRIAHAVVADARLQGLRARSAQIGLQGRTLDVFVVA
nr:hypothetical protein [Tanacetum cinerariifolium]